MINEDKQLEIYVWAILGLLIYVIGIAIGWWSDIYFWPIICLLAFGIPGSIIINIIWRGWTR